MDKMRVFLTGLLVVLVTTVSAGAQDVNGGPDVNGRPLSYLLGRWDDLNHRVLFHRAVTGPASPPVIYATDAQGRKTLAIDLLKDFPGMRGASVNVAGGRDGSVLLYCVLNYGAAPNKALILVYDSSGLLKSTIDTSPYEISALTVDDHGNIYAFATNVDMDEDDPHALYPTVIKFDAAGHILRTMMLSSNFSPGESPTDYSRKNGGPLLRAIPAGIVVFSASTGRWFLLSSEGEILARSDLKTLDQKIAEHYGFRRASVRVSFLDQNGALVLDVLLDDGPFNEHNVPPPEKMRFQEPLVRVDPSQLTISEITTDVQNDQRQLLGIDKGGTPVYGRTEPDGVVRVTPASSFKIE